MRQGWIRTLLGALLTLLMLIPVITGNRPELIERLEYDLYDLRLKQFLPGDIDPRIVIVDIDEQSLAAEGRWPWDRARLATLVSQLFENYGVALVGFDMLFAEADRQVDIDRLKHVLLTSPDKPLPQLLRELDSDQSFANAVAGQPVVLGFLFDRSDKQLRVGALGTPLFKAQSDMNRLPIPQAKGWLASLDSLQEATVWSGFFDNPTVDADGVYRRVPLLQRYQDRYYPSLPLAMMLALFDERLVTPVVESDATGQHQSLVAVEAAGIRIPVDERGTVLVPYRGPQGSFPYVSATDVLSGVADPAQLEGAIVLVGTSAAGLLDLRVTPMSRGYAGVEVHANILSGMLDERFLHQPDYTLAVELVQLLLTGLFLALILPRTTVLVSTLLTLGWLSLVVGFNLYAWSELSWVIPMGYTLALMLTLYLFLQITGYFFETRNIAQLTTQFGQYIPPEVVEELSDQGKAVQLTGESREMTVFFSDVRDFTSLSEQLSPQQLTRLMNIYLSGMTQEIHDRRGTVDKYIGDAVMAFWGAPLTDEHHARHALESALNMQAVLPELNETLLREGLPAVSVGMGINTGIMNVGNMGSSFRMAYTVMGDAVNLGARLEGLTKYYGTSLLVSGELAEQVPEYLFRRLDRVQVKGRNEPVDIMEPIGLLEQCSEGQKRAVECFANGINLYAQRQWDEAEHCFRDYLRDSPDDVMAGIYLQRITEFRQIPPPEEWQGIYSHTSK